MCGESQEGTVAVARLTSHPDWLLSRSLSHAATAATLPHCHSPSEKCDFYGATRAEKRKKRQPASQPTRAKDRERNPPFGGPIKISATDDNVDDDDYENEDGDDGDRDGDGDGDVDGDDYENG